MREDDRTGVFETRLDRSIECHHVPLTLDFPVPGMDMLAEPIGLAH